MSDEWRTVPLRLHRSAPVASPIAAVAGLALAAGLLYWFVSRQSQTGIDDRTRQRLMPRRAAA